MSAVAFHSWPYWRAVYDLIFSSDPDQNLRGLNTLTLWTRRCVCPFYVTETAQLLLVRFRLNSHESHESHESYHDCLYSEAKRENITSVESAIRMQGGLAITRFVNKVIDPMQRAAHALPITMLAKQANLPCVKMSNANFYVDMFVEIRHAATHGKILTLHMLKLAIDAALIWMKNTYWDVQYNKLIQGNFLWCASQTSTDFFQTQLGLYDQNPLFNFSDVILLIQQDMQRIVVCSKVLKSFLVDEKSFTFSTPQQVDIIFSLKLKKWKSILLGLISAFPVFCAVLLHDLFEMLVHDVTIEVVEDQWRLVLALKWFFHLLNGDYLHVFHQMPGVIGIPAVAYLEFVCDSPNPFSVHLLHSLLVYARARKMNLFEYFSDFETNAANQSVAFLHLNFAHFISSSVSFQRFAVPSRISSYLNFKMKSSQDPQYVIALLFYLLVYIQTPRSVLFSVGMKPFPHLETHLSSFSSEFRDKILQKTGESSDVSFRFPSNHYLHDLFVSNYSTLMLFLEVKNGTSATFDTVAQLSLNSQNVDVLQDWKLCNNWQCRPLGSCLDPEFGMSLFTNVSFSSSLHAPVTLSELKHPLANVKSQFLSWKSFSQQNPFPSLDFLLPSAYVSPIGRYQRIAAFQSSANVAHMEDMVEEVDTFVDDSETESNTKKQKTTHEDDFADFIKFF